jgi:hypothetical protein
MQSLRRLRDLTEGAVVAWEGGFMSLETCPTCRRNISIEATSCPKCGQPLKDGWVAKVQSRRARNVNIRLGIFFFVVIAAVYGNIVQRPELKVDIVHRCYFWWGTAVDKGASDDAWRARRPSVVYPADLGDAWPFPQKLYGQLHCKHLGQGRKSVWMNSKHATYALNGQTISWAEQFNPVGVDGGPLKIGREVATSMTGVDRLIQAGLALCD